MKKRTLVKLEQMTKKPWKICNYLFNIIMFIICSLQIPTSGARLDKPESSLIGLDRPVSRPQGTLQNTVSIVSQSNYISVGV